MYEILLGQSYYLRFDAKLWAAMQPYPPLGTLYAAATLRARGYSVALFDAMLADSEAGWEKALQQYGPRLAVIYEDNFNYLSKMCLLRMRQAAFAMIAMARRQGCLVIVAGADASDHPELYLEQGAHYAILGEGEVTLAELVDSLSGRSGNPVEEVAGLAYHSSTVGDSSGAIMRTASRPLLHDLDSLTFPAWDLVDIERYRQIWKERHGYFSLNMVASRGCPYHCNWCAKPIWGQRYHTRSPENVVAELEWLKQSCQPDHIWFMDDIFGLPPGWLAEFASLVAERGARLPFKALNRADLLLRPGVVEALAASGCQTIWLGAESGSQKILDAMDKGTRLEQIYTATQKLKAAGIQVGFFLQFGYPGEKRQDIDRTFELVKDCQPDDIGVSVSYPLPGTPFYEMVRAQLGVRQNWVDSNDLAMLYQGPFSTAFYRQLHRVLHRQFRAWRAGKKLVQRSSSFNLHQAKIWLANSLALPVERLRLEWYARRSPPGIDALPQRMPPEEASLPSKGSSSDAV